MYEKDWFMRQINGTLSFLAKKKYDPIILTLLQENGDAKQIILEDRLLELIAQLKINAAENLLFQQRAAMVPEQRKEIAHWFYGELAKLTDEELAQAKFSWSEILAGEVEFNQK